MGFLCIQMICFFVSALNRSDTKDTDIEMLRDVIVDSLFSVLVSLGPFLVFCFLLHDNLRVR